MTLKIWAPAELAVMEEVVKVKAETENGWFCILPRHIDFVTSLVPGILIFETPSGQTGYVAVDQGILVKCGPEVSVSARNVARGGSLGALYDTVVSHFRGQQEKELASRIFEAKLEAELVRQLLEVEKYA
ncbi:MAG: F0F1 ATP synthase subunit epsilon [Acidobacteriales bacterium]|nr:F0F1 ATP synthase subunit epsilon [Terriglobales bacterium]